MTKKVAIIIPALNEEESIADVIDNVLEVGYQNPEYNLFLEIIDGCLLYTSPSPRDCS